MKTNKETAKSNYNDSAGKSGAPLHANDTLYQKSQTMEELAGTLS